MRDSMSEPMAGYKSRRVLASGDGVVPPTGATTNLSPILTRRPGELIALYVFVTEDFFFNWGVNVGNAAIPPGVSVWLEKVGGGNPDEFRVRGSNSDVLSGLPNLTIEWLVEAISPT